MREGPRNVYDKWNISMVIYDTDLPLFPMVNKFIHNLSFLPLKTFRIYENIKIVEILLALIWVGGRGTIKSRTRTFVVLQLVTNVAALIENT